MAAFEVKYVGMAKPVDAGDLKSPGHSDHAGSIPAPDTTPEEPHCKGCGASFWFEAESPLYGHCFNCYEIWCEEAREHHRAGHSYAYCMNLLCELTGLRRVDLLLNPCSGNDK